MRKVFISSTVNDLREYREAARGACLSMGLAPVMMQDFAAMSAGATEGSLKMLEGCDLYIGIFAHRYGYCEDGHDGKSVTEIEFDTATQDGVDRLCFVVDSGYTGLDEFRETDKEAELKALREKIQKLIVGFFTTPDNFKASLTISLHQWLNEHPTSGGGLGATFTDDPLKLIERPVKLIGRSQRLKDGLKALKSGQPLLIQGFAGMGKTALAAEMAAKWIEKNKQPVLWLRIQDNQFDICAVELARPFSAQNVVSSAQGDDKLVALRSVLQSSGAGLVVLDDAWSSTALDELVRAMPPGLPVIVTSRRRYAVGDVIEVGRLAESDALALLAHHAGANTAKDAKAVNLVRLLGHHAFSIRIAGRTMKARKWSPAEMFAKFESAPDRMELPADYGPEERRSVKRLLDASFEALPGERAKQVFLAFGALFSPQATPEMLGLLTGMEPKDAAAALVELDDHGLAERIPAEELKNVEYYRIHDLAASYARAQSTDEQRAAAVGACLAYMGRYQEPGHASFAALRPELDNLLGAAGRALAVGRLKECERFAWELCARGSHILDLQGYSAQMVTLLETAVVSARQRGDRWSEADHLGSMGIAVARLGQTTESISLFKQSLKIKREIGDREGEGIALGNLGNEYGVLGQFENAIEVHKQALTIIREVGSRSSEASILGNLGNAYNNLGHIETAIAHYEQQSIIAREIRDRRGEGNALGNLGIAHRNLGQVEKAITFHGQHLIIAREIGDLHGEGNALNGLGLAHKILGKVDKAMGYYKQALAIAREIGDPYGEGAALGNLGLAHHSLGQIEKAIGFYEQQLFITHNVGDRMGEGNALHSLGTAYYESGELERTLEYLRGARAIYAEIGAQHLVKMADGNITGVERKLKGG